MRNQRQKADSTFLHFLTLLSLFPSLCLSPFTHARAHTPAALSRSESNQTVGAVQVGPAAARARPARLVLLPLAPYFRMHLLVHHQWHANKSYGAARVGRSVG